MTLIAGSKLGPYEIVGAIGAGGMGEVYRAKDTRLDREVAIKILSAELAKDPDLRARFDREAKAISALNHPHICTLYDVGHQDGTDFLVMELLEGESLAERLHKGAMPVQQLLSYGQQIADALERAHRSGIVHRDLKPGNIVITKAGAKLLDFGLAKPRAAAAASAMTGALTRTTPISPITQQGTVVGTFQYMSPEQIEGAEADARSDIFALGAVLYEMATGKRAFEGKSNLSVASAILEKNPEPISKIQPLTPPALEHVVETCLAKDPENRFQTAHDVKLQLKWIAEGGSSAVGVPVIKSSHRKHRERALWAALVASLLVAGALAWMVPWSPKPPRRIEASVLAPEKTFFNAFYFALSPDGTKVAFVAQGSENRGQLWVRPLDSGVAQPLAGTQDASFPFWSPDSENIGFFAQGKLKRVAASGGPVQTLAEASEGRGGTWNRDDVVLFTPTTGDAIYRVSAAGGPVTQLTHLDGKTQTSHRWPWFLPDGKHYLLLVRGGTGSGGPGVAKAMTGIFLGSLDSPDLTFLVEGERRPMYANGFILYPRDTYLEAQPFDASARKVTGDPVPVAEHVLTDDRWTGAFTVSQDGKLMYLTGEGRATDLQWHDRAGKRVGTAITGNVNVMRISPDGSRVAASVSEGAAPLDIWIYDVKRNLRTRFTFNPADEDDPVWSPDGKMLYYDSAQSGTYNLYRKATDGSGKEELLLDTPQVKYSTGISPDGRYLIYEAVDANNKNQYDLAVLPLFGDHKPIPFAHSEFSERMGTFAPDGKWIAYTSSESGRTEVYVAPFPPTGAKFQVSSGGGTSPKWRGDGKELFYFSDDGHMMAAQISLGAGSVQIGATTPLFETHVSNPLYAFDVTRDGQRFLVMERPIEGTDSLSLVVNWPSGLKKK